MDLKEVATLSGKGGLFRVVKPTRSGVILETIDEQKSRVVAGAQHKISLLKEISVYTLDKESSVALEDVFKAIHEQYGAQLPVQAKSSTAELNSFIESVVPTYDRDRVYTSDIKKIINWYSILSTYCPDLFNAPAAEAGEATDTPSDQTQDVEQPAEER